MADARWNIAQICSSNSWGGLEIHVAILSQWLIGEGHRVTVYCRPGSPLDHECRSREIPVLSFAPAGYLDPIAVWRLGRQLDQEAIDLVHAHYARDLWTIAPAMRRRGQRPLIFIKHIGTGKPKRDPLHRWIYSRVDHVIAISRVIEENLLATHPLRREQVSIIHHGLDLREFDRDAAARRRIRQEWGIAEAEILIGTAGRLQAGKGHLEFLDMAAVISARYPQARFVIVGEATRGEEERARPILERRKALGLEERVLMPGFRRDMPHLLAAMDIFAFPSRAEAFGLVLIEAMAAGTAVVSTRSDGVLDIINHEENGLLFDPQHPDELTCLVERLIKETEYREMLGRNGRASVEQRFSRERMLEKLTALYARTMAMRSRRP